MLTNGATVPESGAPVGPDAYQFRIGFNLAGRVSGVYSQNSTFVQTRQVGDGVGNGSVKTFFPKGFVTDTDSTVQTKKLLVIDDVTGEIRSRPFSVADTSTDRSGLPNFVVPITVINSLANVNTTSGWNIVDLTNTAIPRNATRLIIETQLQGGATVAGGVCIYTALGQTGFTPDTSYIIGYMRADGTGDQAGSGQQVIVPCRRTPSQHQFIWRVDGSPRHFASFQAGGVNIINDNAGIMIRIIGYI